MIQQETRLIAADNSGARSLLCIRACSVVAAGATPVGDTIIMAPALRQLIQSGGVPRKTWLKR